MKETNYDTSRFDIWASRLHQRFSFLASLQFAKEGIVSHVYPYEAHKKAFGHDLLGEKRRDKGAIKAIQDKKSTFVGPIKLIQNDKYAIIARLPIFTETEKRFWGFSTVLVYIESFLGDSIEYIHKAGFDFSLKGSLGQDKNPAFYSSIDHDVQADFQKRFFINVPNGTWTLTLQPKDEMQSYAGVTFFLSFLMALVLSWVLFRYEKRAYESPQKEIESSKHFQLYLERTPLTVLLVTPKGEISYANSAALKTFEYEAKELIGKNVHDTIIPSKYQSYTDHIINDLKKGDMHAHGKHSNKTKYGKELLFEWYNTPLLDTEGETETILSIGIDVTQKEAQQRVINEQQKEATTIFETTTDGLAIMNENGDFIRINSAFCKLLEYEQNELIEKNCLDLIIKEEREKLQEVLANVAKGKKIGNYEYTCLSKNDKRLAFSVSCALLSENHLFFSFRDMTKKKELETKLLTLNKELEERISIEIAKRRKQDQILIQQAKLASMGEMIEAIAHQWRQPLTSVAAALFNIQEAFEEGELDAKYLDTLTGAAEKNIMFMSETIDDFRNYFTPTKEKVDFSIQKTLQNALSIVSAQMKAHNIDIHLEEKKEVIVNGYPNEFTQVLVNILGNAKDAIDEKIEKKGMKKGEGYIDLDIIEQEKSVIITVKDNGGGILLEVKERVFEPYYTTKEQGKGTGIGLYMSKMIIEGNMHGTLEVLNDQEGAVFKITLQRSHHG